ncbi:MAG TPA: PilZ domain-containing protein [Nocardioides sp.]|nr:PilZ domain-containing protein [Nocardioides sp.]
MTGPRSAGSRPTLPEVLESVALVAPATDALPGAEVETKVLDLETGPEGPVVVLSRQPGAAGLADVPDVALVWTGILGRLECPVSLHTARRDYGAVWLAVPAGPTVRTQRRSYFRARMYAPVHISWTEEREDRPPIERSLDGIAVDVSEGGLLATVRGTMPPPGTRVHAAVVLDGDTLDQVAVVVRHQVFTGGGIGIAVAFVDPDLYGDRVRRAAFEAERRRLLTRR